MANRKREFERSKSIFVCGQGFHLKVIIFVNLDSGGMVIFNTYKQGCRIGLHGIANARFGEVLPSHVEQFGMETRDIIAYDDTSLAYSFLFRFLKTNLNCNPGT